MIVELQIKNIGTIDINTEISEEFGIPLIFNIADIKNISQRKSSFSKTISIIGSKNNNNIFNKLYEIKGTNFSFKITNKHDCILLVDKTPIIEGFFVLKKINKLWIGNKYEIIYEINIFNENKNFFELLGEKKLNDLDFSTTFDFKNEKYGIGDHTYRPSTIGNAINNQNDYSNIYTYPLIDYGYSLESGKTYPYDNKTSFSLLYPAVYFKSVLDKIFYDAGWTYSSEFLDGISHDTMFKKLAFLYNKKNDFTNFYVCEYNTGPFTTDISLSVEEAWSYISLEKDIWTFENSIQRIWYETDNHLKRVQLDFDEYLEGVIDIKTDGKYQFIFRASVADDQGGQGEYLCEGELTRYMLYRYNNEDDTNENIYTFVNTIGTSFYLDETTDPIDLKAGDYVYVVILHGKTGYEGTTPGNCTFQNVNISFNGLSVEMIYNRQLENSGITYPDIMINDILPDMKQSDFIKNLIKMFNLYIEYDKNTSKNLLIEPRDDFYKDGIILNWDKKVDYNKPINVYSLNDDITKEYNFTYELGNDWWSLFYKNDNNEIFGTKNLYLDSNYLQYEQLIKLDFQSYILTEKNYYRMPVLYDPDNINSTYYNERVEYKPLVGFIDYYEPIYSTDRLRLGGFTISGITNYQLYNYPFATNYMLLGGKGYDLNFYVDKWNYIFEGQTYLFAYENDLYYEFYSNMIENLISDDSRKIELFLYITIGDIITLNMRNRVFIDGQIYYIEKIEYDPSVDKSSKVILLKQNNPLDVGDYQTYYLLKNDEGDYILTNDVDKIPINN